MQVLTILNSLIFLQEFDEKSKDCLENVKLKDMESGSYINDSYIQMYLQAKSSNAINNN